MPLKNKKPPQTKSTSDAAVEILPFLFLGPRSAASQPFLTSHSINHVLSIGSSPPTTLPDVTYTRIPLLDTPTADLSKVYDRVAIAINAARGSGGKILVHCSAAVSRSPTVVTAYLMIEQKMTLKEALGTVVRARNAVNPNPGLFEQLKVLEVTLRGCSSLDVDILPSQREQKVALFDDEA
ncbi:hypothetical protein EUX98_g5631 [Antrodiella citrinella]|uniref:protein-tyrosine-phosphatase n=1 Tax=Antrodiella citrinella TaxID=2447956 RepID=A0A4S4MSX8_9APHY|nr:hypothetical protein EUX98_g5631 [Antrodiella citrinella]